MSNTPSLEHVIRGAMDRWATELHTAIPAVVKSYDAETQTISAQPLIRVGVTGADGERDVERLPIISDVPVMFLGAGVFRITFPIAAGDTVLLIFSEASLDKWLSTGGDVDPLDDRRFHLSDAIAIPGLRSRPQATPVDDEALTIEAPAIKLGSVDADDPVALKSDLDELKSAISGAAVVANDGGAAFKANILAALASWPACSEKVTAE